MQSGWINDGAIRLRILALKPSCPVALLTEILLMISAACCGLISGMTKLVVALSADEINFFSFESSKTVTRVIVLSYLFQNLSEKVV